jgi:hypothetical protein
MDGDAVPIVVAERFTPGLTITRLGCTKCFLETMLSTSLPYVIHASVGTSLFEGNLPLTVLVVLDIEKNLISVAFRHHHIVQRLRLSD